MKLAIGNQFRIVCQSATVPCAEMRPEEWDNALAAICDKLATTGIQLLNRHFARKPFTIKVGRYRLSGQLVDGTFRDRRFEIEVAA